MSEMDPSLSLALRNQAFQRTAGASVLAGGSKTVYGQMLSWADQLSQCHSGIAAMVMAIFSEQQGAAA